MVHTHRRGFIVFRILAALLLIGLLAGAGVLIYQAGQAQGYALGVAAGANPPAEGVAPVPLYPGYYAPWFYRPHFFPWGGILLALLALWLVGGLVRMSVWRHWGMHRAGMGPGHDWAGHGWGGPYHRHEGEDPRQGGETPDSRQGGSDQPETGK